ncbi:MAG: hypothetical protein ACKN9U_03215, partial [Pirellulaceae bacterium]
MTATRSQRRDCPDVSPICEVFKMLRRLMLWVGVLAGTAGSLATAQGLTPNASLAKMQLPEGLRADLLASEPWVRQPVAIDWDDRGRLWVLQYLQYPNPEGLR